MKSNLGKENPGSNMLVIPSESIVKLCCSQNLAINLNVAEVGWVSCSFMQPGSSPEKLILVPRVRAVERANVFLQPIAVCSSVLVSKCKHLLTKK